MDEDSPDDVATSADDSPHDAATADDSPDHVDTSAEASPNDAATPADDSPAPDDDSPDEDDGGRARRWPRRVAIAGGALVVIVGIVLAVTVSPDAGEFPDGMQWSNEVWDGALVPRTYTVGIPDDLPPGENPAVILLHGITGTRNSTIEDIDVVDKAIKSDAVLVLPQGLWGMWNAGQCCGMASLFDVNDVGFIDAVIEDVAGMDEVDPNRVFVMGASNGGLMAVEHLCQGEVEPAAVATVAAIPFDFDGCEDRDVPLIVAVGEEDPVFPFDGGRSLLGTIASGRSSRSWSEMTDDVVRSWECDDQADTTDFEAWSMRVEPSTPWHRAEYVQCRVPLTLTTTENTFHTWLYGGDWSHTKEAFSFFGIWDEPASGGAVAPESGVDPGA